MQTKSASGHQGMQLMRLLWHSVASDGASAASVVMPCCPKGNISCVWLSHCRRFLCWQDCLQWFCWSSRRTRKTSPRLASRHSSATPLYQPCDYARFSSMRDIFRLTPRATGSTRQLRSSPWSLLATAPSSSCSPPKAECTALYRTSLATVWPLARSACPPASARSCSSCPASSPES